MIDHITFNSVDKTITIVLGEGLSKTYADAVAYLADHPDREADIAAIGWL